MDFINEENRIYLSSDGGKLLAEITFPAISANLVNLNHTFVDDSLRGQGIAGQLVQRAVEQFQKRGLKAVVTCSYAKRWFAEHPEHAALVKND